MFKIFAASFFVVASTAFASEADLQKQIQDLSEKVQKIQRAESASKTTLGGYAQINFNKYEKTNSKSQIDLTRFVLTATHQFDEQFSFNGELEVEHAVASKEDDGEVEVEQAYINYQISPNLAIKTGLFLMPFGFLNESHEPPVFYGVERNEVETRIIPSTWREGGIGVYGSTGSGIYWDAGIVTGFDIAKFEETGAPLAGSHQELQNAKAQDLSIYAAVNYKIPGLTTGLSLFTGKSMQGNADFNADNAKPNFDGIGGRVTLADVHARWQHEGFDVQGIYAKGMIGEASDIDDAIQTFNTANPTDTKPFVPEEFYGWMLQAAYKMEVGEKAALAPFARYEQFNTQSKMPAGFASDKANKDKVTTMGLSFLPHPQIVYKADYQIYADNRDSNRFNVGMGYMF